MTLAPSSASVSSICIAAAGSNPRRISPICYLMNLHPIAFRFTRDPDLDMAGTGAGQARALASVPYRHKRHLTHIKAAI